MILFLDFDGVLHTDMVYRYGDRVELRGGPDDRLFQYADVLLDALEPHPSVQLVLSTSWVPHLGFDRAKSYLPEQLQTRVIGATFHRHAEIMKRDWLMTARYYQILVYVSRHGLTDWLAIDDDADGWPSEERHHLVHCADAKRGLGDPSVVDHLRAALAAFTDNS